MKHTSLPPHTKASLLACAALCATSTTHAAIVLAEYTGIGSNPGTSTIQLSDGSSATGNTLDVTTFDGSYNEQHNISSGTTTGRYTRYRIDLRYSGLFSAQGGSAYDVTGGTNMWLTDSGGWNNTTGLGGGSFNMGSGNFSTSNPAANGFTANDGTGVEEINWMLTSSENPGLGLAGAVAWGVLWTDTNSNAIIDAGDTLSLKYVLGADTFAEIDTAAELNAAVGNAPTTSASTGTLIQFK